MLVQVNYNASQGVVISVKEVRLTKSVKSEIKEKMIDNLEYKDLSVISRIRGAELKKMSHSEKNNYLERLALKESDLEYIQL